MKRIRRTWLPIDLHVMAVGDLVSAISIHHRYETSIFVYNGQGDTKLTDLHRHDESYLAVSECLEGMDPERISLYIRGKNAAIPPKKIPTEGKTMTEILNMLQRERSVSNYAYVVGSGEPSFISDYQEILQLMQKRNAPQEEYEQLNNIYGRYVHYKSQIKSAEGR